MNFFSDETRNAFNHNRGQKKRYRYSCGCGCNLCLKFCSFCNKKCINIKSYSKQHPYIFWSIITGIVVFLIALIIIIAVVASRSNNKNKTKEENAISKTNTIENKDNENDNESENDKDKDNNDNSNDNNELDSSIMNSKFLSLSEAQMSEVMSIYNSKGDKDQGTLAEFCEYLKSKSSNLSEKEKVFLSYYWITKNIKYGELESLTSTELRDPDIFFKHKTTVCTGYARLFKRLLVAMDYNEDDIKNIVGYSKGQSYDVNVKPQKEDHEWNAVKIDGNWCLIDATWDIDNTEILDNNYYYLCTPPKCFVRDHLPLDDSEQFLDSTINLDQFHNMILTHGRFCYFDDIEISEDKSIYQTCSGSFTVKYSDDYQSNVEFFQNYLQTSFKDNIEFNTEDNDNRIIVKFNVKKKGSYSVSLPMMINSEEGYGTSIATMYIKCE